MTQRKFSRAHSYRADTTLVPEKRGLGRSGELLVERGRGEPSCCRERAGEHSEDSAAKTDKRRKRKVFLGSLKGGLSHTKPGPVWDEAKPPTGKEGNRRASVNEPMGN